MNWLQAFNWADWFLIILVAISIVFSVMRGLAREIFSLASWVAACVIAYVLADELALLLRNVISTPSLRQGIAMVLLFAATLIVGAMLNHVFSDVLKKTGLTATDRILGSLFGLVRGVVIAMALLLFVRHSFSQDPWWNQSLLIPHIVKAGLWSQQAIDGISQITH